jgi:hypothetical protein
LHQKWIKFSKCQKLKFPQQAYAAITLLLCLMWWWYVYVCTRQTKESDLLTSRPSTIVTSDHPTHIRFAMQICSKWWIAYRTNFLELVWSACLCNLIHHAAGATVPRFSPHPPNPECLVLFRTVARIKKHFNSWLCTPKEATRPGHTKLRSIVFVISVSLLVA